MFATPKHFILAQLKIITENIMLYCYYEASHLKVMLK